MLASSHAMNSLRGGEGPILLSIRAYVVQPISTERSCLAICGLRLAVCGYPGLNCGYGQINCGYGRHNRNLDPDNRNPQPANRNPQTANGQLSRNRLLIHYPPIGPLTWKYAKDSRSRRASSECGAASSLAGFTQSASSIVTAVAPWSGSWSRVIVGP